MLLNEYDVYEHGKELFRVAEQARLAHQSRGDQPRLATRMGHILLSLGAQLVTPTECEMITTPAGYTVKVCSGQAA